MKSIVIMPSAQEFDHYIENVKRPGEDRDLTTPAEMLREYPQLTMADIRAALAYGTEMSRRRFVDMPMKAAS